MLGVMCSSCMKNGNTGTAERFEPAVPRSKGFDQNPLDATYFGPACLQTLTNVTTYGSEYSCHVLNIWRPAGVGPGANLPVLLFVPGGTNDFGEAEPYNASIMASDQHAVICSINYRVGPFGFVALKEQACSRMSRRPRVFTTRMLGSPATTA